MGFAYFLSTVPAGSWCNRHSHPFLRRSIMTWSKPEFIDWRFGFEITLYIANR